MKIDMVDLKTQYDRIKVEIDKAIQQTITSTRFIGGDQVIDFSTSLASYLGVKHVITCANGTDALQIAMMALGLERGDEVIVPAFTYVATAEVIALLDLIPIMVDVDPNTFEIDLDSLSNAITTNTKAIVPVHLYGQTANMDKIMAIARDNDLKVIEDTAQAIGSQYTHSNGDMSMASTIGDIGTISFFPSKNLGCYGDGGCIVTNDDQLAAKSKMIANHGQSKKYHHAIIGMNSRLDAIQAGILSVKLKYLDDYARKRQEVAAAYDSAFASIGGLQIPVRANYSTHVFHQYTIKVKNGKRDELKSHLQSLDIPSMIYYPLPLYAQEAFRMYHRGDMLPVTEQLCRDVLSLPIHTEMQPEALSHIISGVTSFFN